MYVKASLRPQEEEEDDGKVAAVDDEGGQIGREGGDSRTRIDPNPAHICDNV